MMWPPEKFLDPLVDTKDDIDTFDQPERHSGPYTPNANNKPFQHFGCACALGRVNRYPESRH